MNLLGGEGQKCGVNTRGVHELGNGNFVFTNNDRVFVLDVCTGDGVLDIFDSFAYLDEFAAGCP